MSKIIIWFVASILSAALYHVAGKGGFKRAKLLRRLGCSIIALSLYLALAGFKLGHIWAYLVFIGLNYGALSTYHDYLAPDKNSENWLCWIMTGFCYGISAFPLCIVSGKWIGFVIRTIILAIGVTWFRERSSRDEVEELGSGGLYTLTLPLLLL